MLSLHSASTTITITPPLLLLLLLSHSLAVNEPTMISCNIGQWHGGSTQCYSCPAGFKCDGISPFPIPCPKGTRALESSGICCPIKAKCPADFAVDNNSGQCGCVSLRCPKGQSFVQTSTGLQCEQVHKCIPCISRAMVQNEDNCQCFRIKSCSRGGSFWRHGPNWFACFNDTQP